MDRGLEKQLNNMIEEVIKSFINFLIALFKNLYRGIRKLNKKVYIISFITSFVIPLFTVIYKHKIFSLESPTYINYLIYYLLILSPLIYLIFLGQSHDRLQQKYKKIFNEIGFIGKDGKPPFFIASSKDGIKDIYIFKSNIPLEEWKKAKGRLENGIDCNIIVMNQGKNKKLVELVTVSSDYNLPEFIKWNDEYIDEDAAVITVGVSLLETIKFNLNKQPHVLIAGETGSGKSVILRTCLRQMVYRGCRVYMFDFKGGVEFGKRYEKYGEVVTDRNRAIIILDELIKENEHRLRVFRDLDVKNLDEYNKKTGQKLCRIGVFSDEIGEMLEKKGVAKEEKAVLEALEGRLSTLARLARCTGINLYLGVQRPDATVLTGQIKSNITLRICGRFADKPASEIVLGNTSAANLPEIQGRFLFKLGNKQVEFQSYYFDDDTMMTDVDVEVGDMFTKAPVYHPSKEKKKTNVTTIKNELPSKERKEAKKSKVIEQKTDPSVFDEEILWSVDDKNQMDFNFDYFKD